MIQNKYIRTFIFFIPALILQLTVVPLIAIENAVPDLILILLVYTVLNVGQFYGTAIGFAFGLIFDLVSGGVLGSSMFSMTFAAFITGYFFNENKIEYFTKTYWFAVIVFIITFINSIIYTALSSSEPKSIVMMFLFAGLLPAFYSAVICFPMLIFKRKNVLE